jgi:hyaluronoglucosaminidase
MAITPDGTTAYVANTNYGTVTPIDTATNTAGTPIPVGSGPWAIAITP